MHLSCSFAPRVVSLPDSVILFVNQNPTLRLAKSYEGNGLWPMLRLSAGAYALHLAWSAGPRRSWITPAEGVERVRTINGG